MNAVPYLSAPGADVEVRHLLETFTRFLKHKFELSSNTVKFAFFSAEEGGLLGSGEVATEYAEQGKKVKGLFHMYVLSLTRSLSSSDCH